MHASRFGFFFGSINSEKKKKKCAPEVSNMRLLDQKASANLLGYQFIYVFYIFSPKEFLRRKIC